MKKKIIGIFIIMLMISSTMTTIIYPETSKVQASDEEPQSVNLDFDWVWSQVENFSWVTNRTDWSGEYNIPKGRTWATAGENYTIAHIIKPAIDGPNSPCGLTNYTNISIGYLDDFPERNYSSKIVIHDYNLTIHNGTETTYIPYNESFPLGVGCCIPLGEDTNEYLDQKFNFSNTEIEVKNLSVWDYIQDHLNVSCTFNNSFDSIIGPVVYLNTTDSVPVNHDFIFILNEEPASEEKLDSISNSLGCILIENSTKEYTFENSSQYNFTIAKLNGTDSNFSTILEEISNGSVYFVDNVKCNTTLVFSNFSNKSCFDDDDWVAVIQLDEETDFGGGLFFPLLYAWRYYPDCCKCLGVIMSNYVENTHYMSHTVRDWDWFNPGEFLGFELKLLSPYFNRFPLPILSINGSQGDYLIENEETITVDGFIDQAYRQQTSTIPGVISHNVVAYRNISKSPNDAIVVLSNRIDGHWGETPGDSGVGGAILLGIAKYFHDNNITPKYNLTFLFTTGEEYGMRGAQHFVDSHPIGNDPDQYNFKYFIGFDQLCFNYTRTENGELKFEPHTNNDTIADILRAIESQTNYEERTHGAYDFNITEHATNGGAEDYVWNQTGVDTILFEKGGDWDGHHQVGENFSEGDSLKYIDRNDVNVTFEFAWNVTKYFTVNPNCWFDNISFTALDSPNDGDTLNDSIQTNFTIHSILPNDKVRVELNLSFEVDGVGGQNPTADYVDYLLTSQSQNESYVFTIPDSIADGYYNVSFTLYNSTGRINKIVYDSPGSYYNDTTGASGWYHLYHPLGYTKIGDTYKCVNDNISGSVFTANEYGTADNITAFINQAYMSPGSYNCMLYRASDNALIGTTTSDWVSLPQEDPESSSWWAVFNFTGTKPLLLKGTQYVMTCWGDPTYSRVYYNESSCSGTGRYDAHSYGAPPDPANFTNESRYYSIYCSYTPDSTLPQITVVNASPHTVGFGYNVTITANATDDLSGVDLVKVQIGYPGGKSGNFTMTHTMGETYQYLFTDTWLVGQYNYTIWVIDNSSNSNSSTGYHFHVSADASISIATLQDSYTGSQYINITDPPNSPENYTLIDRGLTWDNYYDTTTGQNILEVSTGPINYPEENGTWTPINTTLSQLAENHSAYVYGYRSGNDHGLYGVYFKSNAQQEWPIAFAYNKSNEPTVYTVRSKLVGVGYVDPQNNWAYQYLQNVQSSQGQTNDYSITYPGVFTGTDVTWSYGNTGMKEEITLSNTTKAVLQNHPPSQYGLNDTSSYLVFITKLDYKKLNLYNNSGVLEGNVTISDAGVDFRDVLGQFKCALPLGEAYELNNESARQKLTYRIVHLNGNTYLLSGLKLSDLNTMTFPVVIDPTLTVYSSTNDGYIEQSSTSYNTAWTTSIGTVHDTVDFINIGQYKFKTTYYIYRGFLHFNTSALPSNAYFDNATLSLYKRTDYSTTDFDITIQNGQPTYPHDPLQTSDYNKSHYSGNGGALNTANLTSGYNPITLTNLTWINASGTTNLCLRSSRDISGIAPTGNEFISVYSRDFVFAYPPKLVISYRNQSKIKNTGSTDIKGYLLIQVQFYNSTQGKWLVDDDTINETTARTITSGNQFALDTIFNAHVRASDLTHGTGTYRVYAAFRDPEGNILRTNDDVDLEAWWQFSKT